MGDERRAHARTGRRRRPWPLIAVAALLVSSCAPAPAPVATPTVTVEPTFERTVPPAPVVPEVVEPVLDAGAVNSGHPTATRVGLEVLAEGGNAVDAAIATAFAVTVAEPFGSGLGGGGSAILVAPGMTPVNVDYRDVVPASGVPGDFTGVPGLVAGLWHLHEQYGTLPWDRLVRPAVDLARDGVPVSDMLHNQLRGTNGSRATRGVEHFRPRGAPLSRGDLLVQRDLARSLETVAEGGADAFYRGDLADALGTAHRSLDAESLAAYEVQVSEPPSGRWAGFIVLGASPALPGPGFIQLLQLVEALGVADVTPGSAEYVNIVSTALRRALRTMADEIGDPAFVDVDSERITDRDENARIAAGLSLAGPDPRPDPEPDPEPTKTPKPKPTKKPDPRPTKKPEPTKKPDPSPTPEPDPEPTDDPDPSPDPTVDPSPEPSGTPDPDSGGASAGPGGTSGSVGTRAVPGGTSAAAIGMSAAVRGTPSSAPYDPAEEETSPGETTHLTVVDSSGLMVTMTNTLTSLWGSGRYVEGFFLNDQLNRFGKISGPLNRPSPGRRTVSWSLPAIVVDDDGRPVLGIGSPAGQRIPAILTNVMTRWGIFGQDLQTAVDAPRFHAAGRALDMELAPGRADRDVLERMGYQITAPIPAHFYFYGSVQAVEVDWQTGKVSGAEDSRREGSFGLAPATAAADGS